ncbi:MAG TPA: helix-turn-helix domain-containing protein [Burkholderiaceae bacterium]|nr:helix-turn-helix domain-containing protein [Burkholderiaceae bacterium]
MDRPPSARAAPEPRLFEHDSGDTRTKILEAAFRRLATEGYAALSVREIAKDAGVNHALINYHFRTKDQLVIEVLDAANQRLLARQATMYGAAGGFADKWAEARRFYEDDLASGFVRVQAELWAASLANRGLRATFLPRLLAWKQVVLDAVRAALATLQAQGVKLPAPFTAEVLVCWITYFWVGMEFADLLDMKDARAQHEAALDAVQWLLRSLDAPKRPRGIQAGVSRPAAPKRAGSRTAVKAAPRRSASTRGKR